MSNSSFGRKWASGGRNGLGNTALSGEIVRAVLISGFDQNVRQIYAKLLVCQASSIVFLLYFIASRSARMPEGYTWGILPAYTKRAATPLLCSGSPLIYQLAKRLAGAPDRSAHDAWLMCQPRSLCVLCLSVAESQFVAIGLDVDRLCFVHGAGQQGLAQVVKQQALQGTLYRTGTKFGVETGLGHKGNGIVGHI